MSFNWAEYLNLAEALIRERATFASEEACFRAAISRTYYSAFCAARNRARDIEGLKVKGSAEDHRLIRQHYQKSPHRERRKIGNWLARLRKRRNRADYDDIIRELDRLSATSLTQAREILNALKTL